jgi:ferritin-like metal-binding protein YciE
MKQGSTQLNTLNEALESQLNDIYDAEKQLVQKLPQVAQAVSSASVRKAIENHLAETRQQINRLEQVFDLLDSSPQTKTCTAMRGILQEADEVLSSTGNQKVKDAVIIGALQRVEHYEIAAYGTVCAFADELDLDDVANLLEETLEEEKDADKELTRLAEGGIFRESINAEARPERRV